MMKQFRYRGAAGLLCIFLLSAALSGCGAKYEKITLPELDPTETAEEYEKIEESIELEDLDGAAAADESAVANISVQENVRTRTSQQEAGIEKVWNGHIVAVDAGHQAKPNLEKEPVGPGSETMKAKVEAGSTGIVSGLPEHKLTLQVAQKVKARLEEEGYRVVMIRESSDVNVSNAERARIANESGADILVKLHANALDTSSVHGTLSMCQTAKNPYNGSLHSQSYQLSKKLTDAVCLATGFKNRGVQETDTMSGINWCQIPVSLVEMGFMSNPEEDRKMAQEEYQELIAGGIVSGIDAYFAN